MLLNCGVGEDSWESPLDCKESQPVHPKGDQSWIFIRRTDAEAETPILWPPDVKNWLMWKDPDAEKDWRWEEKGTTEDEMAGWHHRLDGHEFEKAPGAGDVQEAWCAAVHRVAKSWTQMRDWTEWFIFLKWLPDLCASLISPTPPISDSDSICSLALFILWLCLSFWRNMLQHERTVLCHTSHSHQEKGRHPKNVGKCRSVKIEGLGSFN